MPTCVTDWTNQDVAMQQKSRHSSKMSRLCSHWHREMSLNYIVPLTFRVHVQSHSFNNFGGGVTALPLLHLVKGKDLMHFDICIQVGNCHAADMSISPRWVSFLSPTLSPQPPLWFSLPGLGLDIYGIVWCVLLFFYLTSYTQRHFFWVSPMWSVCINCSLVSFVFFFNF